MKKYTLLSVVLFSIFFASCSKTLYYAWEGEEWGYCTLEVKKHQIIYRGTAPAYMRYFSDLRYVYLYGNEEPIYRSNIESEVISIDINNPDTRYCVLESKELYTQKPQFKKGWFMPIGDLRNNPNRSVSYIKKNENSDTLSLIHIGVIRGHNDYYDQYPNPQNVQDSAMQSKGIVWFPPKMYRVEKIDYKKFGKGLQNLNLKDPWKGTKNGDPRETWFN